MKFMVKLDCSPYPNDVWFTTSINLYNRKRTEITGLTSDIGDMLGCVSTSTSSMNNVIGVFDNSYYTLVHEMVHLVVNIADSIGMDICVETTEPTAYLFESLYRQCVQHLIAFGEIA